MDLVLTLISTSNFEKQADSKREMQAALAVFFPLVCYRKERVVAFKIGVKVTLFYI